MHNLLPEQYKQHMNVEYRIRWTVVVLLFLAAVGAAASIALIPSYILSYSKYQTALQENVSAEKTLQGENEKEVIAVLKEAKEKMNAVDTVHTYGRPLFLTALIGEVVSRRGEGIRVDSLALRVKQGEKQTDPTTVAVSLSGIASTRTTLVEFSNRLRANKQFSDINLPVADLAQSSNIDFSISFTATIATGTAATVSSIHQ